MRLTTAIIFSALIAGTAWADSGKNSVIDADNNVVVTKDGSCVRTKWDGVDPCAPKVAPVVEAPPAPEPVVEAPKEPEIALEKRTVYFDFDKADLREDAIATLDALVAIIQQDGAITKAITIGYTDLMGADEYNMTLSKSRAEAVQAYLASKLNIPTETGEVRGLGVSKTAECAGVKTRTKRIDCLGPDRRVEIEMTYQK